MLSRPIRALLPAVLLVLITALAAVPAARAGSQQSNPFQGAALYVAPDSPAARLADGLARSRPADARALWRLAAQPVSDWLGDWLPDAPGYVRWYIRTHDAPTGGTAFFTIYDIPHRDCSGVYSAGGTGGGATYRHWVDGVAEAIGAYPAIIVVEPDALPDSGCLGPADQAQRLSLIAYATRRLASLPRTSVYIDAGRSDWKPAGWTADMLRRAGVARARGFALDVTGYATTAHELRYGDAISRLLGGKHFVVNTSRNGRGPWAASRVHSFQDLWCNQRDRSIGPRPTTRTGDPRADAFEWILHPGYSDGPCNGGAKAGTWWPEYALELARNAAPSPLDLPLGRLPDTRAALDPLSGLPMASGTSTPPVNGSLGSTSAGSDS